MQLPSPQALAACLQCSALARPLPLMLCPCGTDLAFASCPVQDLLREPVRLGPAPPEQPAAAWQKQTQLQHPGQQEEAEHL